MNNEMISVPRATLQKWLDDIGPSRHVTQYASLKRDELRALLAKPDAGISASVTGEDVLRWMDEHAAAQPQGEPVHMVRSHGSCCWEEMRGESLELCLAQPGEYEIRKFYTDQPAQVAVVLPERREIGPSYPYLSDLDIEWNDCIDETERLNPGVK